MKNRPWWRRPFVWAIAGCIALLPFLIVGVGFFRNTVEPSKKEIFEPKNGARAVESLASALSFDGTARVESSLIHLPQPGSYTLECWVFLNSDYGDAPEKIHGVGHVFSYQNLQATKLLVYRKGFGAKSVYDRGTSSFHTRKTISNELSLFHWTHLAVVVGESHFNFYQNGELIERVEHSREFSYVPPGKGPLGVRAGGPFLGGYTNLLSGERVNDADGFRGLIREVRVTDGARYHDRFDPQWRFEPDDATLLLWHCDQQSGETVIDESHFHNNGKIVGAKWTRFNRDLTTDIQ